ncbi:MAG: S-methyl-5-thioribose-1-phosphate isomerase [Myxococcales bacterium]|nr:S-methyl-5-thioribose-1-phosphate isomerase [Myxococcales bacterium]
MLDQTVLPTIERYHDYTDAEGVAAAIRTMVIRGAPAIGIAAAFGLALGLRRAVEEDLRGAALRARFDELCEMLAATRPTAVNLFWAIERMRRRFEAEAARVSPSELVELLVDEATAIHREDVACNRRIGALGAPLLHGVSSVLTHCNTGALATGGYGTALGVIRRCYEEGHPIRVLANETRPFLQGARLTAWECQREGIDVRLLTDAMAGHFMARGAIGAVIVGADRVAANGDTANKIGTYTMAVLAHVHRLPFYVAAPISTIDLSLASGELIPIEERAASEVSSCFGQPIAPEGVAVCNPAFDVTPGELIAAIITERGVARPPYDESLAALVARTD